MLISFVYFFYFYIVLVILFKELEFNCLHEEFRLVEVWFAFMSR